jgi:hypothetical protein
MGGSGCRTVSTQVLASMEATLWLLGYHDVHHGVHWRIDRATAISGKKLRTQNSIPKAQRVQENLLTCYSVIAVLLLIRLPFFLFFSFF